MSRPWRIEYEGALYHVLSRGNNGGDIFIDDQDRRLFQDTLGEMAERFDVDIFAYVLLGNHYHLLLRTNLANLSRSMQWFGVAYTRRFNNRHLRSGHLFQGRFKSILVQNDAYLFQLSCYIHRNPLSAGLIKRLADYKWSSYRPYAYGTKPPEWLSTDLIMSQLGNISDPHRAYREKAQRYAKEEQRPWEDLKHGFILGSRQFSAKIREHYLPAAADQEMPQQARLRKDIDIAALWAAAAKAMGIDAGSFRQARRLTGDKALERDMLIYILWQQGCWSNQKIGKMFNLTYSAVSRRVSLLKEKLARDAALRARIGKIKSQIKM